MKRTRDPVTTRPSTQKVFRPRLDLDTMSFTFEGGLDHAVMEKYAWFKDREARKSHTKWFFSPQPDINVAHVPETGRIHVNGSPHKAALGESVGPFGPVGLDAWVTELALLLDLEAEQIKTGRIRRLDIAANLPVSAPPCDYIALVVTPPRMNPVRIGETTITTKHTHAEVTLYDKVRKLRTRKRSSRERAGHLLEAWRGQHVLRVEAHLKDAAREFGRVVTLGDLCDPAFWPDVAECYHTRTQSVELRRGGAIVPPARSVPELKDILAARGIEASGGLDAALDRIQSQACVGSLTKVQEKKQRQALRALVLSHAPGDAALAEELNALLGEAVEAARSGIGI